MLSQSAKAVELKLQILYFSEVVFPLTLSFNGGDLIIRGFRITQE